jgi:hypothetical protein
MELNFIPLTVDPTSSGITTTKQGGSFTAYSGNFA